MILNSHRFEMMIVRAVRGLANILVSFVDQFSNPSSGRTFLMIPVRRGRHGGSPVSVRFDIRRKNRPSWWPWPLSRDDRD